MVHMCTQDTLELFILGYKKRLTKRMDFKFNGTSVYQEKKCQINVAFVKEMKEDYIYLSSLIHVISFQTSLRKFKNMEDLSCQIQNFKQLFTFRYIFLISKFVPKKFFLLFFGFNLMILLDFVDQQKHILFQLRKLLFYDYYI